MTTYRELLSQVKGEIDEIDAARPRAVARTTRPSSSTSASTTSGTRGTSPARSTCRAATSSRGSRTPSPTTTADRRLLRERRPLRVRDQDARGARLRGRRQPRRRLHRMEAERLPDRAAAARSARSSARRYSRHLLIPEVGEEGQLKLLESRILLIGAGGLGSPASLYLAAAGVGTLGIVDDDAVDATNLQRQIVHSTERLGDSKAESAKRTIEALNPDVSVTTYQRAAHLRERRPDPRRRLGRDRRRRRQLPDALPAQRRVGLAPTSPSSTARSSASRAR